MLSLVAVFLTGNAGWVVLRSWLERGGAGGTRKAAKTGNGDESKSSMVPETLFSQRWNLVYKV